MLNSLLPPLVLLAAFLAAFAVYCVLRALGKTNLQHVKHDRVFGPFLAGYLIWLIGPLERRLIGRVVAEPITVISLAGCAATGAAAGVGALGAAAWLYGLAGILDILDGRLARLGQQADARGRAARLGQRSLGRAVVFAGYTWFLRESPWLLAVLGAFGGSVMVSYTRARAEGLGVELSGGMMQRAERIGARRRRYARGGRLRAATAQWIVGRHDVADRHPFDRHRAVALAHRVSHARRPREAMAAEPTPEPSPDPDPGAHQPAPSRRAALMLNNVWVRRGFLLVGVGLCASMVSRFPLSQIGEDASSSARGCSSRR